MDTEELKISLARIYYPVKSLGPGNRVGIWLNGCSRNCDGCISPELKIYKKSKEVSVSKILEMVRSIQLPIDGFTISGGEPFFHPWALNALVQALVNINDDILIFTGYTIEELKEQKNDAIESVIETCSALIDGPYIKELNDGKGLRGSTNQRCFVFKHHNKYRGIETAGRTLQTIICDNMVLMIGIP